MASQEGHHNVVQTLLGAGAGVNIARYVSDVFSCGDVDVYALKSWTASRKYTFM